MNYIFFITIFIFQSWIEPAFCSNHYVFKELGEVEIRDAETPPFINPDGSDIQDFIDEATPYSTIIFDRNIQLIISKPIVIRKALILKGLNARLPDSLGSSSILEIESEGVSITDFFLKGNANTVSQEEREALIKIYYSDFRLERGVFENSSKDGVKVSPRADSDDIAGGVIRDIVGKGCMRDVVSLSGTAGENITKVTNILVENIRAYDSPLRGPVELSDGTGNITVRTIYAENCRYAIDVQDHNHAQEINRNILIDDVYALNCEWGVRTYNHRFGHTNLTLSNITAENCEKPLQVSNTDNLRIQNVHINGHEGNIASLSVKNCDGLRIENLSIINSTCTAEALLINNCNDVTINGVSLLQNTSSYSSGVTYSISDEKEFTNLQISSVSALNVTDAGIVLEKANKKAKLSNYIISGNIAKIADRIKGNNSQLINNIIAE